MFHFICMPMYIPNLLLQHKIWMSNSNPQRKTKKVQWTIQQFLSSFIISLFSIGIFPWENSSRFPWGIFETSICAPARGALRVAIRRGAMLGAADQRRLGLSVEEPGGCAVGIYPWNSIIFTWDDSGKMGSTWDNDSIFCVGKTW